MINVTTRFVLLVVSKQESYSRHSICYKMWLYSCDGNNSITLASPRIYIEIFLLLLVQACTIEFRLDLPAQWSGPLILSSESSCRVCDSPITIITVISPFPCELSTLQPMTVMTTTADATIQTRKCRWPQARGNKIEKCVKTCASIWLAELEIRTRRWV